MLKTKLISFCVLLSTNYVVFGQNKFTYSKIDSIVTSINNSKNLLNILDTGRIEQGEVKGRFRDCYIVDTINNVLKAFIGSVTISETNNSTVVAFYFHELRLIKVEIGDIAGGYKKHNLTYLYYINEKRDKTDVYQSKELKKLKYLKLSEKYIENFRSGMIYK